MVLRSRWHHGHRKATASSDDIHGQKLDYSHNDSGTSGAESETTSASRASTLQAVGSL